MTTQKLTELLAKVTPGEWELRHERFMGKTEHTVKAGKVCIYFQRGFSTEEEAVTIGKLIEATPILAKHVIALAEALGKIEADSAAPWIQSIARNALNTLEG
jgi:hypothetical protein